MKRFLSIFLAALFSLCPVYSQVPSDVELGQLYEIPSDFKAVKAKKVDRTDFSAVMTNFLYFYSHNDKNYKDFVSDYKEFKKDQLITILDQSYKSAFSKFSQIKFGLYPETLVQLNDDFYLCNVYFSGLLGENQVESVLLMVMSKDPSGNVVVLMLRN